LPEAKPNAIVGVEGENKLPITCVVVICRFQDLSLAYEKSL
jgi:hypothetical protein